MKEEASFGLYSLQSDNAADGVCDVIAASRQRWICFLPVNLCEEMIKIDKVCHTSLCAGQTVRTTLPKGRPSIR